jgi:hypothetical protein
MERGNLVLYTFFFPSALFVEQLQASAQLDASEQRLRNISSIGSTPPDLKQGQTEGAH